MTPTLEEYDIRTVQNLLGHKDVRIDMHVLNRAGQRLGQPS